MPIKHVASVKQLLNILVKDDSKLSVIDFHATWCGPCLQVAPYYDQLSNMYPSVNFLKVDVDAVQDVAYLFKISAMPTFTFLKGTTKVDQVRGPDLPAIQTALRKYSS